MLRAHHDGVPFVVVIGDREVLAGTLAARGRAGTWRGPAADVIAELGRRCAPPELFVESAALHGRGSAGPAS